MFLEKGKLGLLGVKRSRSYKGELYLNGFWTVLQLEVTFGLVTWMGGCLWGRNVGIVFGVTRSKVKVTMVSYREMFPEGSARGVLIGLGKRKVGIDLGERSRSQW